jgi:hypothetical protein
MLTPSASRQRSAYMLADCTCRIDRVALCGSEVVGAGLESHRWLVMSMVAGVCRLERLPQTRRSERRRRQLHC